MFCNTSPVPESPETVPPIVYVVVVVVLHVIPTFDTFALAVPVPLVTVHICAGFVGWVNTETL